MNIFEEFIKCQQDFVYFAEKYLKLVHPLRGLIPIQMYDFQKRLIKTYDDNQFVLVKKFRNGGFSTFTALYGVWLCMFHQNKKVLITTYYEREIINHMSYMITKVLRMLPDEMLPILNDKSNDHKKVFNFTNSIMYFYNVKMACSPQYCIKNLDCLIIDEPAFIPEMNQYWALLYPTLAKEGKCFVVSTPNGTGNWFYETYFNAEEGKNSFHIFDCHYKEHPEHTKEWEEQVRKNLGPKSWCQEIEANFLGSEPTAREIIVSKIRNITSNENIPLENMLDKIKECFYSICNDGSNLA